MRILNIKCKGKSKGTQKQTQTHLKATTTAAKAALKCTKKKEPSTARGFSIFIFLVWEHGAEDVLVVKSVTKKII